jgi:outer membrane protein TolC
MREQALDAQLDLRRSARRPTLHAFASAGGGLPGYNLFDDRFRPMAMAGLKLQWNFLDWGVTRRAEAGAGLQRAMLEQERDRALRRINITLDAQQVKIAELDRLIEKDDALIALLGGVVRTKGNQLALGTATASDYLTELNKENAARLGREMHQLQRLLAIRLQLNIAGQ